MRAIPTDSADARELREAAAAQDAAAAQEAAQAAAEAARRQEQHEQWCRRGWLGVDDKGRPRPCLVCRPWLLEIDCRTCGTPAIACRFRPAKRRGLCCDHCDHQPHPDSERTPA